MTSNRNTSRWIAGLLVAAVALATVAPAAEAGKRHTRYKKARYERKISKRVPQRHHNRHVIVHRSSDGLPALAFFGGLVLGAVLSHDHDDGYEACAVPRVRYRDPYCDRDFESLDVYVTHLHHHPHPRIVHVIDVGTGNHVTTYRYYDGGWVDWEDEW